MGGLREMVVGVLKVIVMGERVKCCWEKMRGGI